MKFIIQSLTGILRIIVYTMVSLLPRNRKLAVFGAWNGDRYCDNPKYLMLYLLSHSDYKCVWVGKEHLRGQMPNHDNFYFVPYGSWSAVFVALRARCIFCCVTDKDVANVMWQGGALRFNLWHGIPLKYMGERTPFKISHTVPRRKFRQIVHSFYESFRPSPWWTVTASRKMSDMMVACYPELFSHKRILEIGTPRNDYIISNSSNFELRSVLKEKYGKLLGFAVDKKIVLYMPTWRMCQGDVFTFSGMELDRKSVLEEVLRESSAVLIEKHHQSVLERMNVESSKESDFVIIGSSLHNEVDPLELCLITDVLITDYSSIYIDFGLLNRPCIHFIYDYGEYKRKDSGLAYDLHEVAGGPCVKTFDELTNALRDILQDGIAEPKSGYRGLVKFENGECCNRLQQFMDTHV